GLSRRVGEPVKGFLVQIRHDGAYVELHARDRVRVVDFLNRATGRRLDTCGRSSVLLEVRAQRHAETRRFGGSEQLFRIRTGPFLESGAETVLTAQAGRALEAAFAASDPPFPLSARLACRHSRL